MNKQVHPLFKSGIIIHPCPNLSGDLVSDLVNYLLLTWSKCDYGMDK